MIIHNDPPPLRLAVEGDIRLTISRIQIEILVDAYNRGQTPEEIAAAYDTLTLDQVYSVIAYYLRHKEEVDEYIRQRDELAETPRREIEAKLPLRESLRAKLQAHRAKRESGHASPSE